MLHGIRTGIISNYDRGASFLDTLTTLSLTTGLQLCLDAGEKASYDPESTPGSVPQLWNDRSGGGYNFYLGADGTATGTDPTFNGPTNLRDANSYFNFDGGDYFTLAQANPTWVNNLHKNNAKFTCLAWVWLPTVATTQGFFHTRGSGYAVGVWFRATSTAIIDFVATNGTTAACTMSSSAGFINGGGWTLVGVSVDEAVGAGGGIIQSNDAFQTFNSTYTSPSASNAAEAMKIGKSSGGGTTEPLINGSHMAVFAMWEGVALTQAQMLSIFNATKGRFGLWSADDLYDLAVELASNPDTAGPIPGGKGLVVNSELVGGFDYCVKVGDQTVSSFNAADWFTSTADSRSAFVVVDGDLTIDAGQVFRPTARKLFTVLYVTGDLTVNGEISMTARGANHSSSGGSNIAATALRIATGTFSGSVTDPQVPAAGANGGAASATINSDGQANGSAGSNGSAGQTGGGGGGAATGTGGSGSAKGGAGAAGSCFSGGSGGGGSHCGGDGGGFAGNATASGGPGGTPGAHGGTQGAGNPTSGDGGVLAIFVGGNYSGSGAVTAAGQQSTVTGTEYGAPGGSSGGGSVTILVEGSDTGPAPSATGAATRLGQGGGSRNAYSGKGGDGTARKLKYHAHSVRFDGADRLSNGALTGQADSKKMTLSVWVKLMGGDGGGPVLLETTSGNVDIMVTRGTDNKWQIFGRNAANTDILNVYSVNTWVVADGWHHILFSVDMAVDAWLYINDASDESTTLRNNDTLDITPTDSPGWGIGNTPSGSGGWLNAEVADLMFWDGVYVDLSVEANRRKFVDANGKPVNPKHAIDAFGEPIIRFSGLTAGWNANKGSGGGTFTVTGALADGASSPSD